MATVNELIAELQALPEETREMQVIMSADGEGNRYSPYSDYCTGRYEADSTWSGDFTDENEDDDEPLVHNAVVLWPVN